MRSVTLTLSSVTSFNLRIESLVIESTDMQSAIFVIVRIDASFNLRIESLVIESLPEPTEPYDNDAAEFQSQN